MVLNHFPQIIKQLPNSISERLSKNSFNQEILNTVKVEYKDMLKKFYCNINLKYTNKSEKPNMQKWNIIWFSPPVRKSVLKNIAKIFFQVATKHFPRSLKLQKIFNCNTVNNNYSCMNNTSKIIIGRNKKVTSKPRDQRRKWDCRKKQNVQEKGTAMLLWKQCALPIITTVALWQLMHLGTWCTVVNCSKQWIIYNIHYI